MDSTSTNNIATRATQATAGSSTGASSSSATSQQPSTQQTTQTRRASQAESALAALLALPTTSVSSSSRTSRASSTSPPATLWNLSSRTSDDTSTMRQRPSIFSGRNEGVPGGESSDSSSGPEQTLDEDADMTMNADDSNTSIGDLVSFKRMTVSPPSGARLKPFSPIYTLPPELLIAIFRKLSSPVDWRNTMLVSRQWASLAVELLWQRPYFCEFKNYQAMVMAIESKNAFFDYPQLIRRLNLTFIADKINNGSLIPLQKCTRLERVTLTNCTNLTDSPLKDILAANPRIQALDLSQLEGITDETLLTVAENCPRLQGLNLMGCKGVTDASLIPLSKNRRILRRVSCFSYLLRGGCLHFEPQLTHHHSSNSANATKSPTKQS